MIVMGLLAVAEYSVDWFSAWEFNQNTHEAAKKNASGPALEIALQIVDSEAINHSVTLEGASTKPPVASSPGFDQPKAEKDAADQNAGIYIPHPPFGEKNLKYRRVCARVGAGSLLCMTLKYPMDVPLQDPAKDYPSPYVDELDTIGGSIKFIDGSELKTCISLQYDTKACLDASGVVKNRVFGIWTRNPGLEPDNYKLFGIQMSDDQNSHHDHFFQQSTVLVLGASPSPGIAKCMASLLFGKCQLYQGRHTRICDGDRHLKTPTNQTQKLLGSLNNDEESIIVTDLGR
jgi:hypothetical protein